MNLEIKVNKLQDDKINNSVKLLKKEKIHCYIFLAIHTNYRNIV